MCEKFTLVEGDLNSVKSAIQSNHPDIEDSIQYFTCMSNHLDAIVTSDKDFLKLSKPFLPVITPEELMDNLVN